MKKIISAILLFSLLLPALTPLATLASGRVGIAPPDECAVGGQACMEGDRCTLNHRQCRTHANKKGMSHGGHHDGAPGPAEEDRCTLSYRCGNDESPEASFTNPLETPFLLCTNHPGGAPLPARLFRAVMTAYDGPYRAPLERPPSISL